ncbi:MAG: hypothetical protein K2M72_09435 [Paramuribaculum sp.]|nr:hypothetical protein [Paramuribaculum sp.]
MKLKADVPHLETIISKTWGKEDELKQLKSELAALDRKITPTLAPENDDTTDREKVRPIASQQEHANITPPQSSLVAEPQPQYKTIYPLRSTFRSTGL